MKYTIAIFYAGSFDSLSTRIRHPGHWQGLSGGHVEQLKPLYRLQLAEQSFVVYQHLASFSIER